MPAGIMIPARPAPSMIGSKAVGPGPSGSSSALDLGQPNLLEGQLPLQHQLVEMTQPTAESEMARGRGGGGGEEDFESKSGSENIEGASGDDQDPNQRSRKKRYHRHTQHQIQEMEA